MQKRRAMKEIFTKNQINGIIFALTGVSKHLLSIETSNLRRAIEQYTSGANYRCKHQGLAQTIKILKEFHLIAIKLAIGKKFEPLTMIRSDKCGFPKCFHLVKPYLVGSAHYKRIGLSISKLYLAAKLPIDPSTDSITSSCSGSTRLGIRGNKFLIAFAKRFESQGLDGDYTGHKTTKSGPNGPALMCSMADMVSISKDFEVGDNLETYVAGTSPYLRRELLDLKEEVKSIENSSFVHGRLSKISEGGGKTRTIAIGDYFSQEALKSLFQDTMRFLKSLDTDGTYDQGHAVSRVKQAMIDRKPIYCLDLKNATDRFPRKLQEDVLEAIYGPNISRSGGKLIAERNFSFNGNMVRYSVGQPMGLLSSWSVFALTHHAIVQHAASRVGITSFSDYVVLGDDIVIFNKRVAERYIKMMNGFGVEISQSKTLIGVPGDRSLPSAEFAKRILGDGQEITPIPGDLMQVFLNNPIYELFTGTSTLRNLGITVDLSPLLSFVRDFSRKRTVSRLEILATAPNYLMGNLKRSLPLEEGLPLHMESPGAKYPRERIQEGLVKLLQEEFELKLPKLNVLTEKISRHRNMTEDLIRDLEEYRGKRLSKSVYSNRLSKIPISKNWPLVKVINNLKSDMVNIVAESRWAIKLYEPLSKDWSDLGKSVLTVTDDVFGSYASEQRKLSRVQSSVTLKLYKNLNDIESINITKDGEN